MVLQFTDFTDLLKELIRHPSVTGDEHAFFRILQRTLEERGATVHWYEGLLVAQGNDPKSSMLSAHIDRHGLVCTGPNEFQYAAFVCENRSDLLGNSVSEQLMSKIADRFTDSDVMAYEPWNGGYLGSGKITDAYIDDNRNNLIFEIEGLEDQVAGTPIAFTDRLTVNEGYISGQLDNVIMAAMLVHLFSMGYQGTAFFTAQEETGKSWRYLLEWFRRFGDSTNELVVLDTSPFPDIDKAEQQDVVLRYRDANASFNKHTTQKLVDLCTELNIGYMFKDLYIERKNKAAEEAGQKATSFGSTEMGRIIAASNGLVNGTTLQIPTTGYHTMDEMTTTDACRAMLTLLKKYTGLA